MKKLTFALTMMMGVFASCSNENETPVNPAEPLPMAVKTAITHSRAMITGTSLDDKSEIGVTLVENKDDATTYDNLTSGYHNVAYKVSGTTSQTWTAVDKPIYLSATDGKAVAYYPYKSTQSDYKALTVETQTQIDYLYSGWVKPISNSNPEATFEMKHALTGIRINLKKGSYTSSGVVEEIRIASDGFGIEGTLDASTGKITGVTTGEVNSYMMRPTFEEFTLRDDYFQGTLLMVVPVADKLANVDITVMVDDKTYKASGIMSNAFLQGNIYTFELTLNNNSLVVSGEVSVTEWVEDSSATTDNGGVLQPAS